MIVKKAMKIYPLLLSQRFPATHPRHGEPTYFKEKIYNVGVLMSGPVDYQLPANSKDPNVIKLHTLRGNYDRWYKIFEQIYAWEACLSLRVWSGKPYRSKQIEIARLTKDDGIGIQKLEFPYEKLNMPAVEGNYTFAKQIARNDGLLYEDWEAWFKSYDLSKPLAIIHFTSFRY